MDKRAWLFLWVLLATAVALTAVACSSETATDETEPQPIAAEPLPPPPPSPVEPAPTTVDGTDAGSDGDPEPDDEAEPGAAQGPDPEPDDEAEPGAAQGPDPEPDDEDMADAAVAPSKSDPAGYTRYVVDAAIEMYESEGLEAAVAHYSDPASVDGQWYVFIIDGSGDVIAHPDDRRVGLDIGGPLGTDINGYKFGPQILAADEAGRWVPFVYANPEAGVLDDSGDATFELKNSWVVRHDGLLFASGWYISAEELLPAVIAEAAQKFREGGIEAALAYYNDPQGVPTGLIPTVEYYNSTDTLDGYFTGIIASPDGEILSHIDPNLIGSDVEGLLGPAIRKATSDGTWISAQDNPAGSGGPLTMRMWAVDVDGTLIAGGWYRLADNDPNQ